jgi:hypothetical protein
VNWRYGETIAASDANGIEFRAGVFNENEVRAAAGLTMVLGAIAFVYAFFDKVYEPIQIVTTFFFVEFLIRVTLGLRYSPIGVVSRLLTRRYPPEWVSAKPKRFAWSIGVGMSFAMMIITNSGIRGLLPMSICLLCLALMWLESVLGLCVGCELYAFGVRRGWRAPDEAFEVCSHGVCQIVPRKEAASVEVSAAPVEQSAVP